MLRCIDLIPYLDENKLLEALGIYKRGQLYQKAGYILEEYRRELSLSDAFFADCASGISASKTYLFDRQDDFVFHEKWRLYAPRKLKRITDKGIYDYDAV